VHNTAPVICDDNFIIKIDIYINYLTTLFIKCQVLFAN